ncbi:esterase OVCA2 [Diretmus argenteus]
MAARSPLRILCIHGYRQNGVSFREKTGALRKLLKKQVELVYMTAPLPVPPACSAAQETENGPGPGSGSGGEEDPRGWWFSDIQARSFSAQQQCQGSLGLDDSVRAVREAVKDLGPFDGILGFSQGAALVAMLCSLQEQNVEPDFSFRFAILVAGFRSACEEHQTFYKASLQIPSLHVFGLQDRVIPDNMSRELLPTFQDPQVLTHPGGHFVPAASAHRQTYQDFLKRFQ